MARPLSDLLPSVEGARLLRGSASVAVAGVSNDTRILRPGDVFVAVPGFKLNGLDLIPEALRRGAAAIVAEEEPTVDTGRVPVIHVPAARAALADLAGAYHDHPSRALKVVGITGTDGKTSVTHLLSAVLEAAGLTTGWITTVSTKIGVELRTNASDHTTPEAPLVQATLAEMRDAGLDVAILETSSHALSLDRVRGVHYTVGIFTNLTREHLNFHGSFEAYLDAKAQLFARVPQEGLTVLNADDEASAYISRVTRAPVMWYGLDELAEVTASNIVLSPAGTRFVAHMGGGEREIETALVGRFNVANWLAAYGGASYFGASLEHLQKAARAQGPVPGRMTLVQAGQPFPVVVDFAHTPGALEKVLQAVRSLVPGRVLLVFGMAGGRDAANRPTMGALAASKSDFFVLTTDDPYEEEPADIAAQIASGARDSGAVEGKHFAVELDRRRAIALALERARAGDAVVLAGIGHESRLAFDDHSIAWDELAVAREELAALGYASPSPTPR